MTSIPIITDQLVYELCIETTCLLNKNRDYLKKIKWTNGEANLDMEYSNIACEHCTKAWAMIQQKYISFKTISIICEPPDINITFTYTDGSKVTKKIELKSSKKTRIPGSTIKKLDVNQPLIYCLRPSDKNGECKLRCSQYITAMVQSDIDLFQDRTPRPQINFDKMPDSNHLPFKQLEKNKWIPRLARCAVNRLKADTKCQSSWQDDLTKEIAKIKIEEYLRNTSIAKFIHDKFKLEEMDDTDDDLVKHFEKLKIE